MSVFPASPPLTPTKRKISPPVPVRAGSSSSKYFSPPSSTLASTSMSSPSPVSTPSQGPAKLPPLPTDLTLPPLPSIADKELETLAFTHSSYTGKQKDRHGLDLKVPITDNEKLEHVGDSLLGCVVTLLLHQLFPNLGDGTATVLKSHLVNNATLAQISSRYGLHKRFIAAPSTMFSIQTGEKSRANLFEAYIAALYGSITKARSASARLTPPLTPLDETSAMPNPLMNAVPAMDDGMAFVVVSTWLRGVFTPIALWAFEQMKEQRRTQQSSRVTQGGEDDGHMDDKAMGRTAQLNEFFTRYHGKIPKYDYTTGADGMWSCLCTAIERDGETYTASATRGNKKIAAQVAAWKICVQLGWE